MSGDALDPEQRYRLCQRLDLKCDSTGGIVVWIPSRRMFSPVTTDALVLLTAFGEARTIAEACRQADIELDEEVDDAMRTYLSLGLLLRTEKDAVAPERIPTVFDRISSLDLPVLDVEATIAFYRDALGALVACHAGETTIRFGETALVPRQATSILPTRVRLDARHSEFAPIVARLEARGVAGGLEAAGEGAVFACRDPSGHRIEIHRRKLRTSRSLSDMASLQLEDDLPPRTPRHLHDRLPSWVLPFAPGSGRAGANLGLWANWEQRYDKGIEEQEHLPWYSRHFDPDVAEALTIWAPLPGRFVELGCGPGAHAARLAALGYQVTAVDLVELRIRQAVEAYEPHNPRVKYRVADVLDPQQLTELGTFDYAFDRACYHVMGSDETRRRYVASCARLIRPGGRLFLKAMSDLEPAGWGPSREVADQVAEAFSSHFRLVEHLVSSLESTLTHNPKALLCVLERREAWEEQTSS
jgi:SAM-dependent methyltransferase/catechol 2,3-dioxygenase-like lactoylglutathione lyase family enzyme